MDSRLKSMIDFGKRNGPGTIVPGMDHISRRIEWLLEQSDSESGEIWDKLHRACPKVFSAVKFVVAPASMGRRTIEEVVTANHEMTLLKIPFIPIRNDDAWLTTQMALNDPPQDKRDFLNVWTTSNNSLLTPEDIARMEQGASNPPKPNVGLTPRSYKSETASEERIRKLKGSPLSGRTDISYRETRLAVERGIQRAQDLNDGTGIDHYALLSLIMLELFSTQE